MCSLFHFTERAFAFCLSCASQNGVLEWLDVNEEI